MNWSLSLLSLLISSVSTLKLAEYSETATIIYLPNHNLLSEITFKLSHPNPLNSPTDDLGSFPSLIYALPKEFGLTEGKISFTRGLWNSKRWGKAPNSPASSGFQFHGHFKNSHKNVDLEQRFNEAIEVISGYFCASLNVLQYLNSIKPTIPTFPSKSQLSDHSVIAGIIPHEPVCVENLQPWLDLLPCSNRAGIPQMLKPESIYQSDFHSIEIFFTSELELTLKVVTVYDLNRWNCNRNWSLTSIFGRPFEKPCPLSQSPPKIILKLPPGIEFVSSLLQQKSEISSHDDHLTIEYEGDDLLSEIGATDIPKLLEPIDKPNPFKSYRYKSGSSDDFGALGLVLENDQQIPLEITVIESIPWLFRLFLHRSEFTLNFQPIKPSDLPRFLKEFKITPAINRKRNALIQSKWIIPPKSRIQIHYHFEREFLRIDEFPQNSERGIELPGALIFYSSSDYSSTETTNTLLFNWPLPDCTMPFNVITMTSTLAALFYGSFFNLIFRRFYLKHPNDPPPGFLPKIIWKIKRNLVK